MTHVGGYGVATRPGPFAVAKLIRNKSFRMGYCLSRWLIPNFLFQFEVNKK